MKSKNEAEWKLLATCPVCGRKYIPAPQHIYRAGSKEHGFRVCSWGCVRKWEKARELSKKRG